MSGLPFCFYMCTYSCIICFVFFFPLNVFNLRCFRCTSSISDVRAMAVSINVIVSNVSTVMSFIYCLKINFKKIKKENPFFRQLIKINQYNIYTCSSCSLFNLLSEVIKDYWVYKICCYI